VIDVDLVPSNTDEYVLDISDSKRKKYMYFDFTATSQTNDVSNGLTGMKFGPTHGRIINTNITSKLIWKPLHNLSVAASKADEHNIHYLDPVTVPLDGERKMPHIGDDYQAVIPDMIADSASLLNHSSTSSLNFTSSSSSSNMTHECEAEAQLNIVVAYNSNHDPLFLVPGRICVLCHTIANDDGSRETSNDMNAIIQKLCCITNLIQSSTNTKPTSELIEKVRIFDGQKVTGDMFKLHIRCIYS
jgi:hypothetical protein